LSMGIASNLAQIRVRELLHPGFCCTERPEDPPDRSSGDSMFSPESCGRGKDMGFRGPGIIQVIIRKPGSPGPNPELTQGCIKVHLPCHWTGRSCSQVLNPSLN